MGAAKHYVNKLWEGDEEEVEEEVEAELETKIWKEGDEAEAKFTDGEYYWGKISKAYKNGNFLFHFDDGDKSRSTEGRFIRERTPIVGPDESDITDGIEESEKEDEDSEEDMEVEATISYNKKYYTDALTEFLTAEMKDYEYFLYGTRTNSTESFHNLCNKYYSKGSTLSYPLYKMKKQFAALDWNEQKDRQFCVFNPTLTLNWETAIINAFMKRKLYLKSQHVQSNSC